MIVRSQYNQAIDFTTLLLIYVSEIVCRYYRHWQATWLKKLQRIVT